VCASIGLEEEILISCELFNPLAELRLVQKSQISLSLKILALGAQQDFLEVSVVKYIRVHGPPSVPSLVLIVGKSKRVGSHQSDVLIGRQAHEVKLRNLDSIFVRPVGDGHGIAGLSLGLDVFSAHSEDHAWSSAVLNGSVSSELYQIVDAKNVGNVVAFFLDLVDDLHSSGELRVVGSAELSLEPENALRTSVQNKYQPANRKTYLWPLRLVQAS